MTRDLIPQMRLLLVERTGHDYVWVTHAHLTELLDRCEAAEAFGAACIEFRAAKSTFWDPGGQQRAELARDTYVLTAERFAALCIPREADRG